MALDHILVRKVDRGRADDALHRFRGAIEEPLVVGALRGAIGDDQGGLAASPGATAALSVVCGGGRHVSQVDKVKLSDIDAQFHRRRTEHHRQEPGGIDDFAQFLLRLGLHKKLAVVLSQTEARLADFSDFRFDLGRVFARLKAKNRALPPVDGDR